MSAPATPRSDLLQRVSRSLFWNATLLPLISGANLITAVLIRRYFGLESGLYDLLLGLLNTVLFYSALGIPVSLTQFLPRLESESAGAVTRRFLARAGALRLLLASLILIPVNLLPEAFGNRLHLGPDSTLLIRILSVLILLRAANELLVRTLQSLLEHLRANLIQLLQALAIAVALAATFLAGLGMVAALGALVIAAALVLGVGLYSVERRLRQIPTDRPPNLPVQARVVARFALFMYAYELSNYFATPAFASTALGTLSSDRAPLALFNVAFQVPMMIVVVVLSSFQGLYRPMFSRLLGQEHRAEARTAFREVSKVQALLLLPSGVGLALLLPGLLPLLFGDAFRPAVPLALVICLGLFAEAILNLGTIVLSVDRRYRDVAIAQALRLLAAPAFVLLAARGRLLLATAVFVGGRVAAVTVGYQLARMRLAARLPWGFFGRLALPTAAMAAGVGMLLALLPNSWPTLVLAVGLGCSIMVVGLRLFRVLGARELELLRRAQLPGHSLIIAWLDASDRHR